MTRTDDNRAAVAARTLTDLCATGEGLTEFVGRLYPEVRAALSHCLREAASADNDRALVAAIKNVLAGHASGQEPVGALFHTMDFDNGYFFVEYGVVYFADGTVDDHVDFGDDVDRLLTEEFGARGESTTLLVNLRTGKVDLDDYEHDARAELRLPPEPDHLDEHAPASRS